MFVDASAIVAILTEEPEADALADALALAAAPITSPLATFEAVLGVRRKKRVGMAEAESAGRDFLRAAQIRIVSVTAEDGAAALRDFASYGKGQGHPAQLNLGDCFAYAAARTRDIPLLFKGDDFSRTDIRAASAG